MTLGAITNVGSVGDVPYNEDSNNAISYEVLYEMVDTADAVDSTTLPFVGMSLSQSLIWVGLHTMTSETPLVMEVRLVIISVEIFI